MLFYQKIIHLSRGTQGWATNLLMLSRVQDISRILTNCHFSREYWPSWRAIGSPVFRGDVVGAHARARGWCIEAGGSVQKRRRAGGAVAVELGRRTADCGGGGATAAGASRVPSARWMRCHWTGAVRDRYGARLPVAMIWHCVLRVADLLELLRRVPEIHFTALFSREL